MVKSLLETAKQFLQKVKEVGEDTVTVITDNPKKSCLVIASGVVFIAPVVVLCPLLGAAGFGAAGPIAGYLVTVYMAFDLFLTVRCYKQVLSLLPGKRAWGP